MKRRVIIILFLLGLVPLVWFRDGRIIAGGDFSIPLLPFDVLRSLITSWYPNALLGEPNFMQFTIIPWFAFWGLLKFIGFPLIAINISWFIFIFLLTGFSMYFLILTILEEKWSWVVALTASIFYIFNVYIMMVTSIMATPLLYASLPLLLGLYIKGLQKERSSTKYALLTGVASLLIASVIGNPPIYAIWLLLTFFCFLWHLVFNKEVNRRHVLLFTFKVGIIYLFINIWWLYPYVSNVFVGQSLSRGDFVSGGFAGSSLVDTLRLFGSWIFFATSSGAAYIPYAYHYRSWWLILLTFLIPILAFGSVLCRLKNRYFTFFLLTAIIGVMLATGASGPTAPVYEFIATYIPSFWIFREPFAKFTVISALSYAVLIGLTAGSCYEYFLGRGRVLLARAFAAAVILVILLSAWPILTGDVIYRDRGIMKSFHVNIPEYWFQTANWFNNLPGDFRVFVLPPKASNSYGDPPYKWGYGASDLVGYLVTKPLVKEVAMGTGIPGFLPASKGLMDATFKLFQLGRQPSVDLQPILNMMGVEYILQRNDVDPVFAPDKDKPLFSPDYIKDILQNQKSLQLDRQIGELDIYRVAPSALSSRLYSIGSLNLVMSKTNYLFSDSFNFPTKVGFFNLYEKNLGTSKESDKNLNFDVKTALPMVDKIYILGEIKDLKKEQEPKAAIIVYPPVKFRPGEVGYQLTLWKEGIDRWLVRDSTEKLYSKSLTLSNRRIAEIANFGNGLTTAQTLLMAARYENEVTTAIKLLETLKIKKPILASTRTEELGRIIFAHRLKIDGAGLDDYSKDQLRVFLKSVSDQIQASKPRRLLESLQYELEIPQSGRYEMYFGQEAPGLEFRSQKIGEKDFLWGKQEVVLPLSTASANLLDSEFKVTSYDPAAYYRLSFDYQSDKGGELSVVEGKLGKKVEIKLPSTGKEFEPFETFFRSSDDAVKAVVNLFVPEKRNVRLEKYFFPTLLLKNIRADKSAASSPIIKFVKISPAKYQVKVSGVSGPYVLVFSESFHPGWKLSIGKEQIPDSRHVLVNGYANSWLITSEDSRETGNYEMMLEFVPERLYTIFLAVSVLTLLISLGLIILISKRNEF